MVEDREIGVAEFETSQLQKMALEINALKKMDVYGLFVDAFEQLRDESRDLALDTVPSDVRDFLEREQHNGGYRAFKRAVIFFEELAAELNKQLEENE